MFPVAHVRGGSEGSYPLGCLFIDPSGHVFGATSPQRFRDLVMQQPAANHGIGWHDIVARPTEGFYYYGERWLQSAAYFNSIRRKIAPRSMDLHLLVWGDP